MWGLQLARLTSCLPGVGLCAFLNKRLRSGRLASHRSAAAKTLGEKEVQGGREVKAKNIPGLPNDEWPH